MSDKIIYLDNSATTCVYDEVAEEIHKYLTMDYFNPSATYPQAARVLTAIDNSRENVATAIGVPSNRVYFNSGGTEGANFSILGTLGRKLSTAHVIISATEHAAVYETAMFSRISGATVDILKPQSDGTISTEALLSALRADTSLVSIMQINNELGSINDIAALSAAVKSKAPNCVFHCDGVQGFCKLPVKLDNIDFYTASAHKIHGPKGVGAVYISPKINPKAIIYGGGQEKNLRSGTENVPGIIGMGLAAAIGKKTISEFASLADR